MSAHLGPQLRFAAQAGTVALASVATSSTAQAVARTPTISGNGWVALLVIGGLVVAIYMLIRGALFVETRDARMFGGGRRSRDDGWFGIFPSGPDDEEDAPDHMHHHDGDGGEGGGEGGF